MFDISLLAVSVTLALVLFLDVTSFDFSAFYGSSYHSIGLGTLVTTALNSSLIKFSGKLVDSIFEPTALFPPLQKALKLD